MIYDDKNVDRHHKSKNHKHSDGEEPIEVTFEDVSAAAFRIKSGIRKTICEVYIHYLRSF